MTDVLGQRPPRWWRRCRERAPFVIRDEPLGLKYANGPRCWLRRGHVTDLHTAREKRVRLPSGRRVWTQRLRWRDVDTAYAKANQ